MRIINYIFKFWIQILIIFILMYPIFSLFLLPFIFINFYFKINKNIRYFLVVVSFFTLIFSLKNNYLLIIYRLKYVVSLLINFKKIDYMIELKKYLFYYDNLFLSIFFFVLIFSIFVLNFKTKKDILNDEKRRHQLYKRNIKDFLISFFYKYIYKKNAKHFENKTFFGRKYQNSKPLFINDNDGHILAVGTTRSGKTATITNLIEKYIKFKHFTFIVDGKGDKNNYSLHDSTKKLAEKYDRKIYIVSQGEKITDTINPFKNCDSTQIKDMLIALSDWSEEHYKSNASRFWQALADLMLLNNIDISINSIIQYANKKSYTKLFNNLLNKGIITKEDGNNYINIYNESSKIALASISRFATLVEGTGGNIFNDNGFDLIDAYNEKAVVIYLIDKFKYPEYANNLGQMILLDIKKLISLLLKKGNSVPMLTILDEVGVYASDKILDILNKSAVIKNQTIISTQSLSDLEDVSSVFKKQVIDNCNNYLILRNNDPDNAELLSGIIGTKKKNFTTYQSNTEVTFSTGVGTDKIVDEYIINPNDIKKFKKLTGIYYSKNSEQIELFKTRFVNLDK